MRRFDSLFGLLVLVGLMVNGGAVAQNRPAAPAAQSAGKAAMALANLAERDKAQNPAQHGSDPAREKSQNSQNERADGQAAGVWRTMDSRH